VFDKEYLIIPVNACKHWWCVIVVNPGAVIDPKSSKRPYIVYCDSMFEKKPFIIEAIRA
jgi:Ulp1 family protease